MTPRRVVHHIAKLGQGNPLFFTDSDFAKIAEDHSATPAQISISWLVQRGTPPIAKSANVERMKKNITVRPWRFAPYRFADTSPRPLQLVKLAPQEMQAIDGLHRKPGAHRSLLGYHTPEGTVLGWTYEQLGWPMTAGGFVKE